jgi:hypothetical protein
MTFVVIAGVLQLLLAATFVIVPLGGAHYGAAAQRAAEADLVRQGRPADLVRQGRPADLVRQGRPADLVRQGRPADLLSAHGIDFTASRASVAIACSIGAVLAVLAVLVLAGSGPGRIATWVAMAVMIVLGLVVMPGEVFTTRYVAAAFRKSDDPRLDGIDVAAFVNAAAGQFPSWLLFAIAARFALATIGSAIVIVLLAIPAAGGHFA